MKKIVFKAVVLSVCLCLLCGCSDRSQNGSASASESQPEIQTMTEAELHQHFQEAFDAKGNALGTPEQLALELAEVKAIAADISLLPEDYEAQYKEWRKGYVELLLETLQKEYDQILADVPLYDGANAGAAFADYIDFDADGINELAILYLEWLSPLHEWGFTLEVYGEDSGHAIPYDLSDIETPPLHYLGDSYNPGRVDNNDISFVENEGHTYIHIYKEQDYDSFDYYYKVEDGLVTIADETSCILGDGDGRWYSFQNQIELDEYVSIERKYSTLEDLFNTNTYFILPIENHGILPPLSPDAQRRCAFLDTLCTIENNGGVDIQYARLADMDGDGTEDLIVVVEGQYLPFFRIYVWRDSELQAVDLNQEMDSIGGIYREKNTGKIYVNYSGGAGPIGWDYFERISETIRISEEDYTFLTYDEYSTGIEFIEGGQEAYYAELNRFELIEDLMFELPKYDAVEAVRQQLIEK